LPYGCGEQNMLNFVPNIVVLEYLTTLNKLTPEIELKAKKFLESGYQRELTYKHNDGSYSAFGKSDKSGSTWLTAFVAKSFRQATKYINIDETIIEQALSFLSKTQINDGSFPEVGQVFHKDMQGGSSIGTALTAYVLTAFLENQGSVGKYQQTIEKALDYVVKNIQDVDDNYSLAIATYVLQLAKHQSKDSYMAKLDSRSENKNGMKYWQKIVAESDKNNPWNDQPNSVNVEMSAYAMQAFVEAGNETEAVQIMKWLIAQRNENGGFQSTQDTVVGLQALSKLASRIYVQNSTIDIKLDYNEGLTTQLNVNPSNSLILQKHELPSNVKDIQVTATGQGFSILQLSYKYNLNINGTWPRFVINPQMHQNSNKDFMHLTICTSFVPDDLSNKSNMAVMEVSLPSGFTFDTDHQSSLENSPKVKVLFTN
jgi:CD109 antigen